MKLCKHCETEKDVSEFGRDKSKADGLTYSCRACIKAYKRKYDDARLLAAGVKPKRERVAQSREVKLEKNRLWREKNRDQYLQILKSYKQRNKHVIVSLVRAREAVKLKAMPKWVDKATLRKFYELAQKITAATGIKHQVDHIVPLKSSLVCGLHVPANLRVISADANLEKSNKFIELL